MISSHTNKKLIISIHWGLSLGGVGKYATYIDNVSNYSSIKIKSICILSKNWDTDKKTLGLLNADIIEIKSRLDSSWVFKISQFIDEYKPDAVMVHGFNGYFITFLQRFLFKKKVPILCTYHGSYHPSTFSRKITSYFYNSFADYFIKNIADGVICVANYSRLYLINKGVDEKKIAVIHNGIENIEITQSKRASLRNDWSVSNDDLLIGCASRLATVKGIEYLIDAINLVKDEIPSVKLVIVGSGPSEDILKKQVADLNLNSKILFTGFRTDINNCLSAFDIFALPSLSEYHSIAVLEAMRAEKTIIATDVGGNTESVRHLKEAVIVESNNSEQLVKAIKLLHSDPSLRKSLGKNAKERYLKKFTIDKMVNSTAKWLMRSIS